MLDAVANNVSLRQRCREMKKGPYKTSAGGETNKAAAEARKAAARNFVSPEHNALMTLALTTERVIIDEIDLHELRAEIGRACDDVNVGTLRLPERMALAQAHTLNHLFNRLARAAFANFDGPWFEPYMRLALRAQAQSARSLATFSALKHPTVFAKQLNIANRQVVTNGTVTCEATPPIPPLLSEAGPIVRLAKSEFLERAHERVER